MPWQVTPDRFDMLTRACAAAGWNIDFWWRDETVLLTWWEALDPPLHPALPVTLVPAGLDHVAIIGRAPEDMWNLVAIAPADGTRTFKRENAQWWTAGWITPTSAATVLDNAGLPLSIIRVGDRIGATMEDGTARIGFARGLSPTGRVSLVEFATGCPPEPTTDRWFLIQHRNEAFDWLWSQGEIKFKAYGSLRSKLYYKQRKITGKKPYGVGNPPPAAPVELDYDPLND